MEYFSDNTCTTPLNLSIDGPLGGCVNVSATANPISGLYAAVEVKQCTGKAFTYGMNSAQSCPVTPGMAAPTIAGVGVCSASSTAGRWYTASCSAKKWLGGYATEWAAWTSEVITTTHAPITHGSFTIKYYVNNECTTAWEGAPGKKVEADGPIGGCVNTTALDNGYAALGAKALGVDSCDGNLMSPMPMNMAAHTCAGAQAGAAYVGVCTRSDTFSGMFSTQHPGGIYYFASCSTASWTGSASNLIAPADVGHGSGSFQLKYYTDSACTTAAANQDISGPMDACINITAVTSGAISSYGATNVASASCIPGVNYTYPIHVTQSCAGAPALLNPVPAVQGSCYLSASTGLYYTAFCDPYAKFTGDASAIVITVTTTTTVDPQYGSGSFQLKYFTDSACTTAVAGNDISGPMNACINITAVSSGAISTYGATNVASDTCFTGNNYSYPIYVTQSCAGAPAIVNPVPAVQGSCYLSASTGLYYTAKCDPSTPFAGDASAIVITTTPAPTTLAATTVAPVSEETTVAATEGSVAGEEGAVTTAAPAVVTVQASYEATEDLPATITSTQLLASPAYMTAKKDGLAGALGVAASKVTITGFTITGRRLAVKGRSLATKTVTTAYEVEVAATAATAMQTTVSSNAIVATIQTQTTTAMAAQNWASEPVLTTQPTVTVASVAYVGTVTTASPSAPTSSSAFGIAAFGLTAVAMLF
jgi:hypothetical protein